MNFNCMDELLDRFTAWRIPGCTCDIYLNHDRIYKNSSGYSDVESQKKMQGNELMYMYSASKVITAVATMQLIEKGLIHLNDNLSQYIKEFSDTQVIDRSTGKITPAESEITLYDLVSMTSGYDYNIDGPSIKKMIEDTDGKCPTVEFAKAAAKMPVVFQPGQEWLYGIGADIMGAVVEVVSGMKYSDYCRKYIFDPVGMNDTTFRISETDRSRFATQYYFDDAQGKFSRENSQSNYFILGPEFDSGGAGVISTVDDMALFADMLACGGETADGKKILSSSSVNLMRQNHLNDRQMHFYNWGALKGYGYGVFVRTHMDNGISGSLAPLGEFGWTGAAGAFLVSDPVNKISLFYAHYMLNNQETFTNPRLRNTAYGCIFR
jgi:CubicO group peptidase (beta-lactamase class C family)